MGAESCTTIHLWEGVNDIRDYKLVQNWRGKSVQVNTRFVS